MTAQKYLEQVKGIDHRIRIQKKKLEDMRLSLFGKAAALSDDGIPHISCDNSTERSIVRYLEYEERVSSVIEKLMTKRLEIEKAVEAVPDDVQREILERRYLLHQKWETISEEMNYTPRRIFQLHSKALENISVNFT